jgi:C-terminal processing protease CtpA/Prc
MVLHVSRAACWLRRGVGTLLVLALLLAGVTLGTAQDKKDDVKKEEPKKEEPKKDDVKKEEPKKEEPKKDDVKKEEPKKEEPKKEEPKKLDPAEFQKRMDDIRRKFQKAEQEARQQAEKTEQETRKQIEKLRAEMRKEMEELQRQFQPVPPGGFPGGRFFRPQGRLGVHVVEPSDAMTDQLGLDKGKALVITDVLADSPAAKAGLKKYDVLVEFNGKPVPGNQNEFTAMVNEAKANTPMDVVVIRKAKKETIKGVSLPEVKAPQPGPFPVPPGFGRGFRFGVSLPLVRTCGF